MKKGAKRSAAKKQGSARKLAKRAAAATKGAARKPAAKSAGTYTPPPLRSDGWPPFRYPPQ